MKRSSAGFERWACLAVVAAYLAAFSIINFAGFERFATGDMYSDTYISKLMWEQKTIFPEGWVFGNQFYVITTPVLAAFFYGICGSVNLAMALATTTMTALIMVSFVWMVRPFADRNQTLLGLAVLLGGVIGPDIVRTIEGQIFYLMASYYAGYLITLFVVFGDYARSLNDGKRRWVSGALAAALSFCTGMQSLRQTAVMILPLLLAEFVRLAALWRRERRMPKGKAWMPTIRTAVYTAANILGMIVIRWIDPESVTIYGSLAPNGPAQMLENAQTGLRALRSISGIKYLFQGEAALGLIGLALTAAAAAALVLTLRDKKAGNGKGALLGLCLASVLLTVLVSIVIVISLRSIYLFVWYPMVALGVMILHERLEGKWKRVLCGIVCLLLLFNLGLSYGSCVEEALDDTPTQEQVIADYLVERGYTRLYGQWYIIAPLTVWTDGAVTAGAWSTVPCQALGYINPMDIYTEADNENAAYLVTDNDEAALFARAEELGAELTLVAQFGCGAYRLYESDRQLMYLPESGE